VLELRQKYKLGWLLEYSKLPRSTFYYCLKQSKQDKYSVEKVEIQRVFEENKQRYGYRRITALLRQKGIVLNHKTVLKLMKNLNLKGKTRKNEKYHSYKGEVGKIADNLLQRDFTASKPFEKLTTDVTQFNVCDDKIYLSPVMDLYNREIVSYSISLSPNLAQIWEMLNGLFDKLPDGATPIFHSDQGWQYQHSEYQRQLKEHNIIQSMSRKGNCMDNGAMENFFGRLKVEMFYGEKFQTVDEFVHCLEQYISYYNNERISLKLKGMSPVQYRTHSQVI
jgi:transposase InsO family protein